MIKKIFILFISINLFASESSARVNKNCTCNTPELSTTEKVVLGSLVGAGSIIAAPYVLPAGVIAAFKTATVTIAVKAGTVLASTTMATKVSLGLAGARMTRPLVLQTTEEKLDDLLKERATRPDKVKKEFISCLKANKNNHPRNESGRPDACEDAALLYAFSAGIAELNEKTKTFKNRECFCA